MPSNIVVFMPALCVPFELFPCYPPSASGVPMHAICGNVCQSSTGTLHPFKHHETSPGACRRNLATHLISHVPM